MISASLIRAPELSLRWIPVWRRNLPVWRKLAIASVLGNIADPLLYMLALGYAFGLVMNSLAPGYDFFTYFFTLVLTPMLLLSYAIAAYYVALVLTRRRLLK